MSPMTLYLAKVLGLYCVLISLAMMANRRATLASLNAMLQSPPLMLLAGVLALAGGLALVVGHNAWSGGALAVAVTLIGWAALIKGLGILFLPQDKMRQFYKALQYEKRFFFWMGATLLLGLYLAVSGFRG